MGPTLESITVHAIIEYFHCPGLLIYPPFAEKYGGGDGVTLTKPRD